MKPQWLLECFDAQQGGQVAGAQSKWVGSHNIMEGRENYVRGFSTNLRTVFFPLNEI